MRKLFVLSLILLASLVPALPAYAISAPDSGPFVTKVDVYRHCLEDDDMLVVARYSVPYASTPEGTITQTYIGRLMDGSTELASASPYAYYDKGYGYGALSLYLDAGSAPAWEGAYSVELLGSPTLEWLTTTATSVMTGAVADDGGVQTDETAAANNSTANDMTLLPTTPAVNDAYYFGGATVYSKITQNIGTVGAGSWTIIWEYYDGSSWTPLSGLTDETDGLTAPVGNHDVTFTVPNDWATTTIQSISAYWIRGRVYSYTSVTTQPKGTQCWVNSSGSAPYVSTPSLDWRSTTSTAATRALMRAHIISYAEELSDYWAVALTASTAAGDQLSSYGEAYFTNAIPELRTMCPNLFAAGITVPQYEDVEWQKAQSEAIKGTWPLDWGGMSQFMGLPSGDEVFRTLIGFVIVFFICALIMSRTNRVDFAMIAGYGLLIVLAVPGWISPEIVAGFTFLSVLGAALVFVLGKAG